MHMPSKYHGKYIRIQHELDSRISRGVTILCDMDGTLVDTDYANYLSYRRAVREVTHGKHDIQFNPDKRFNREDLKEQVPQLRDAKYESIVSLKADYFSSCLSETKLNTALADVIRKYGKTHETILVTNCQEERAIKTLRYHQILESFTRMLCRDKSSGKGVANKYENAMALLGVSPDAVIVFENGVSDIEKALLTGVPRENIISIWCLT